MNDRQRFLNVMNYKPVDRCVYGVRTSPWPETIERWKTERYDPSLEPLFDIDHWEWPFGWFLPNPPFERKVIEENEDTVLYINHEGILLREFKNNLGSSMPQFVRFPVETREDYRRFVKKRLQPDLCLRIGKNYIEKLTAFRQRDFPFLVVAELWGGFFGGLRQMVGVERLCMLFYDDHAFVEEMMDGIADFIVGMMDKILDYTDVDVFGFWEDMAYKTGPLVGPDLFQKYALPRYKRVVDFLRSRGVEFVSLDSDGNISSLIPGWLDAGINILYPFEVQCGMDVVEVRRQYGRDLRIWYGIDKRALAKGPTAIDAELQRVRPLIEDGGYVPGLDHNIPPDVPFENYLYYMKHLWEIL